MDVLSRNMCLSFKQLASLTLAQNTSHKRLVVIAVEEEAVQGVLGQSVLSRGQAHG